MRAVVDLCSVLARGGDDITLATTDPADIPPTWRTAEQGVPRVGLIDASRFPGGGLGPKSRNQVRRLLAGADLLHLHTPWDFGNLAWASAARARGLNYIVTIHGMLDEWSMAQKGLKKRVAHALFFRTFLNRARFIHLTAQGELDQGSRWFDREKGVVLAHIFDLGPYETLPGAGQACAEFPAVATPEPKLLFLSRLHPKKGADILLRAAALIKRTGPACTWFIAGKGDKPYADHLRQLASDLGLDDCVHFLGLVTGNTKVSLYQACDLFLLPTSQENFGLVLFESLACSTPVITTRGVDTYQELQGAGVIIAEQTPQSFANAVREALADRQKLRDLGARGRRWVFQTLSPDRLAHQYDGLYRRAVLAR